MAACLDATFRQLGGVPSYCLTDNEKTVTVEHVARIAVRNPELVPIARYYGTVVRSSAAVPAADSPSPGIHTGLAPAAGRTAAFLLPPRPAPRHTPVRRRAVVERSR